MVTRGAALLAAWLEAPGHTQRFLAAECGVAQQTVSGWKLGAEISLRHALKLQSIALIPVEAWAEPIAPAESSVSLPQSNDEPSSKAG